MKAFLCIVFVLTTVASGQTHVATQEKVLAATPQQLRLAELFARFDFSLVRTSASADEETVHGSMIWARSGDQERLSIRFDRPVSTERGILVNRDLYRDADMTISHYRPSDAESHNGSVLISEGSSLAFVPTPSDFLFLRPAQTLAALVEAGAIVSEDESARTDNNSLVISCPWRGAAGISYCVALDPEYDHAISSWSSPELKRSARISWQWSDTEAAATPVSAEWSDEGAGERWTLITREFRYGTPPAHELAFRFEPGMLVTDHYNKQQNGKPTVFRINASGNRESVELVPFRPAAEQPGGATRATAAIAVGGLVVLSAWLRLRFK